MILIILIIHNKLVKFSEETWRREPLLSIRYTHLLNILFSWAIKVFRGQLYCMI